jgi:hypothetical protein
MSNELQQIPLLINKILDDYVSEICSILPNLIEGVYVTGSVPLGDYYSKKSDIDFITVLKSSPGKDIIEKLENIHHKIEKTYSNPKLNGYYLTVDGIKNNQVAFPSFFRNKMYFEREFELDKVSLWELKSSSINVYGLPAAELNIDVKMIDVFEQLHQNINTYWTEWIAKHSPLQLNYFLLLLFPRLTEWGLLGVARQLYTLETGEIASKLYAGKYCLDRVPVDLKEIMLTAIDTRKLNKTELKPSINRAKKTIECMKFIVHEFNKIYNEQ